MTESSNTFLRIKTVVSRTGLSRSTLYAHIRSGTFPAPIKIGVKASAWLSTDIDAWQQAQIDASRTGKAAA
ncbi:AlpA family transcriptional regulator [uncultured Thiocystis sp.]|jgi:prophage regulatory protein|uniref:helix-turn-helix transcriptional regulator n=1 Tax=uncultured Thiocystis sp. TaxID=1202134 RepID=UPI0025FB0D2F|nr:AlpA family transcriptional regulator [uncultured Thiocystis sp.]